MGTFFDDAKKILTRGAGTLVRTSGKAVESSKHYLAIAGAKNDITEYYEKIGEMIYKSCKENQAPGDEIQTYCDLIDVKFEEIEQHRTKLGDIKSVKMCPDCKAEVSNGSAYCAKCGAQLF